MMICYKNDNMQYFASIKLCVLLFAVYYYYYIPSISTATARVVLFGSVSDVATYGTNSNDDALYSSKNDILYDTTNEQQQQQQRQYTNAFGRLLSQLSNVDRQKLVADINSLHDETNIKRKKIIHVFNPLHLLRINSKLSSYMKQVLQVSGGSKEKEKDSSSSSSSSSSNTQTLSLSLRDTMINNNESNNKQEQYPIALVPETVIQDCSDIDRFFELFLKTNSKYSLFDKFLQTQGDTNIVVEDWVKSDSNDKNNNNNNNQKQLEKSIMKRTVHYVHPVNVPMAPPTAATRREQTIVNHYHQNKKNPKKKQLYGISIESKTYVDNVPMADCFYSAERMIITSSSSNGNSNNNNVPNNSLLFSVDFGLTFIKKSMFKGIITKSTSNTVSELYKDMIKYIQVSLANEK